MEDAGGFPAPDPKKLEQSESGRANQSGETPGTLGPSPDWLLKSKPGLGRVLTFLSPSRRSRSTAAGGRNQNRIINSESMQIINSQCGSSPLGHKPEPGGTVFIYPEVSENSGHLERIFSSPKSLLPLWIPIQIPVPRSAGRVVVFFGGLTKMGRRSGLWDLAATSGAGAAARRTECFRYWNAGGFPVRSHFSSQSEECVSSWFWFWSRQLCLRSFNFISAPDPFSQHERRVYGSGSVCHYRCDPSTKSPEPGDRRTGPEPSRIN